MTKAAREWRLDFEWRLNAGLIEKCQSGRQESLLNVNIVFNVAATVYRTTQKKYETKSCIILFRHLLLSPLATV